MRKNHHRFGHSFVKPANSRFPFQNENKMLCPLLGARSWCEVSYRSCRGSFPQRGLLSSGDRLRLVFSFVFAARRVQVQASQMGLQRRGQTTSGMRTVTFDPWQPAGHVKLTGVMICERGRRSVTRGRDTVGWLSFSDDKTTASRSTSAGGRVTHKIKIWKVKQ